MVLAPAAPMLEDLRSTNGTTLVRGGARTVLGEGAGYKAALQNGDIIELGSGDAITAIAVSVADDRDETRVVAVRKIEDLGRITAGIEQNPRSLSALYRAQKRIGASTNLEETLIAVADAVLSLVPSATHVTIVLRDVEEADGAYVPMLTRIRAANGEGTSPAGSVPTTRSVFRKVIGERAAVLAADAPRDVGQSESLMGASI